MRPSFTLPAFLAILFVLATHSLHASGSPLSAVGVVAKLHPSVDGGGSLLLEGTLDETLGYAKIVVVISRNVPVSWKGQAKPLAFADLEVGQRIRVSFSLAFETWPVQVEASSVEILAAPDKVQVIGLVETKEPDGIASFFIIAGEPAQMQGHEQLGIMVDDTTQYYGYVGIPQPVDYESLQEGQLIKVTLRGGILEDYPAQAQAASIRILTSGR